MSLKMSKKVPKMGLKWPKMGQNGSKMAQNGSKWVNDPKWVQNGPKMAPPGHFGRFGGVFRLPKNGVFFVVVVLTSSEPWRQDWAVWVSASIVFECRNVYNNTLKGKIPQGVVGRGYPMYMASFNPPDPNRSDVRLSLGLGRRKTARKWRFF